MTEFLRSKLVFVGLLTVLGVLLLKDSAFVEPSYEEMYETYRLIILETTRLSESKADDAEWAAFETYAQKQIGPIVDKLQKLCEQRPIVKRSLAGNVSPDLTTLHIRQPLLQLGGRNGLPGLIETGRAGKPLTNDREAIVVQMISVRKALDAIQFNTEPTPP